MALAIGFENRYENPKKHSETVKAPWIEIETSAAATLRMESLFSTDEASSFLPISGVKTP